MPMRGTTQYCFLREDKIPRISAVTQLGISSFPFSMNKHKDLKNEKKNINLPAVLFRYEMWSCI
jgi:hypothetical protein